MPKRQETYYQYVIDQKITLPRQKSAMLPILDQTIAGSQGQHLQRGDACQVSPAGPEAQELLEASTLSQGPITVYEDGSYAGDTRILDLQPGEERFLSYALDQAVEVKSDVKTTPSPDMNFEIGEANLTANYKMRQKRTYTIKNRAAKDRTVILEHPIQGVQTAMAPPAYGYYVPGYGYGPPQGYDPRMGYGPPPGYGGVPMGMPGCPHQASPRPDTYQRPLLSSADVGVSLPWPL